MKIAILGESPADQAAIRILAEEVLHRPIEPVEPRDLSGGWASAIAACPTELKRLHYNSDAQGLIIMIDLDDSPIHDESHAEMFDGCRVCRIKQDLLKVRAELKPRLDGTEVQIAIACPIPAIEAWLHCGKDPHAAEAPFVRDFRLGQRRPDLRRELKRKVYGMDRPPSTILYEVAVREAKRLAEDLDRLRNQFPLGFGSFYETLATWR